jgi:hypothetical protein
MAKRWSKLKKEIETLFDSNLQLRLHCTDMYRVIDVRWNNLGQGVSHQSLGNFRVLLGKEVLWCFPKYFMTDFDLWPKGAWSYSVTDINKLIREYIDTPRVELLKRDFENDCFQLTNILLVADRRLSIKKLIVHFSHIEDKSVKKILEERCSYNKIKQN